MTHLNTIYDFLESRKNEVPMVGAFGYGSGVFKQKGYSLQKQSMVDLILVVKDAQQWSQMNKQRHPEDYPLGAKILLGNINFEKIPFLTGITYQTHIPFRDTTFKYGVTSERNFLKQMSTWNSFFLPGRFQKPVQAFMTNKELDHYIEHNRLLALLVSLYTLPKKEETIEGLFMHLCSLSYLGDIRMLFVENPNKVKNIVAAEKDLLLDIYKQYDQYFEPQEDGSIIVHRDKVGIALVYLLPSTYLKNLDFFNQGEGLLNSIERKNRVESITQPLIGLMTAGPITSLKYIHEKMLKKEKNGK